MERTQDDIVAPSLTYLGGCGLEDDVRVPRDRLLHDVAGVPDHHEPEDTRKRKH